jgi:hypothetical protein
MTLWVIVYGLACFALWRGYVRGLPRVLAALAALIMGYVCAWWYALPLGDYLSQWLAPAWALPVAIGSIFGGWTLLLVGAVWIGTQGAKPSSLSRFGGAAVNLCTIALGGVLSVWALSALSGLSATGALPGIWNRLSLQGQHPLVQFSQHTVAKTAAFLRGSLQGEQSPEAQAATVALLVNPAQTVQSVQELVASPDFHQAFTSPELAESWDRGDLAQLAEDPAVQQLLDKPIVKQLAEAWTGESVSSGQGQAATLQQLSGLWKHWDHWRDKPEVQALMADPDIQALAQSGQVTALLRHPKVAPLLQQFMRSGAGAGLSAPLQAISSGSGQPLPHTAPPGFGGAGVQAQPPGSNANAGIYQWVDAAGHVYFSTYDKIPAAHRPKAVRVTP